MSFNHVVVWIDHAKAHIIHFNAEAAENEMVSAHSTHPHLHSKTGMVGSKKAPEDVHYFNDVVNAIKESLEILVVGPGHEKLEFMKYLLKHHHLIAEKVLSVETVDHPTDGQLLKIARKYFARADLMR